MTFEERFGLMIRTRGMELVSFEEKVLDDGAVEWIARGRKISTGA